MAPRNGLALITFSALILMVAAAHLALQQPVLGIVWGPSKNGEGLVVQQISGVLPIALGTRVLGLKTPEGQFLALHKGMLIEDPDQYATYTAYNSFLKEQRKLLLNFRDSLRSRLMCFGRFPRYSTLHPLQHKKRH